jgi:hypothetical protein
MYSNRGSGSRSRQQELERRLMEQMARRIALQNKTRQNIEARRSQLSSLNRGNRQSLYRRSLPRTPSSFMSNYLNGDDPNENLNLESLNSQGFMNELSFLQRGNSAMNYENITEKLGRIRPENRLQYNYNEIEANRLERAKLREQARKARERKSAAKKNAMKKLREINDKRFNLLERGNIIKTEIELAKKNRNKALSKIKTLEQRLAQLFQNAKSLRQNSGYNTYKSALKSMRENPFDPNTPIKQLPNFNQMKQMQQMQQLQQMQQMQKKKKGLFSRGLNFIRRRKN